MHQFWKSIIEPVLEVSSGKVVEIGAFEGTNTLNLLQHCKNYQKELIVIDPEPLFEKAILTNQIGYDFKLFQKNSLDVLPELNDIGVVLIDGDHNWYTVYHELKAIAEKHHNPGKFPIVLFHDLSWPYARRDLYYQPESIPENAKKTYAKAGIKYGQTELSNSYHFNSHLHNALEEGGGKNGVLTAVEDFMKDSTIEFQLLQIPVYHGFGIMTSKKHLENNTGLQECFNHFHSKIFLSTLLEELEKLRAIQVADLTDTNIRLQKQIDQLEYQLGSRENKGWIPNKLAGRFRLFKTSKIKV